MTYGELGHRIGLTANAVKERVRRARHGRPPRLRRAPGPGVLGMREGLLLFGGMEELEAREDELLRGLSEVPGVRFTDAGLDQPSTSGSSPRRRRLGAHRARRRLARWQAPRAPRQGGAARCPTARCPQPSPPLISKSSARSSRTAARPEGAPRTRRAHLQAARSSASTGSCARRRPRRTRRLPRRRERARPLPHRSLPARAPRLRPPRRDRHPRGARRRRGTAQRATVREARDLQRALGAEPAWSARSPARARRASLAWMDDALARRLLPRRPSSRPRSRSRGPASRVASDPTSPWRGGGLGGRRTSGCPFADSATSVSVKEQFLERSRGARHRVPVVTKH